MSDLTRVIVLAGGLSHEREVSLRSGRRVTDALRAVDVQVEERDVDATLVDALRNERPDAVFPLLHGTAGEDGAIREILDLFEVPYVGSTAAACRLSFDKSVAKSRVRARGIATPDAVARSLDLLLAVPDPLHLLEAAAGRRTRPVLPVIA